MKKDFIFILLRPDGSEYELAVPGGSLEEAEQRLKNYLDVFDSPDKVVRLKADEQ